jgi:hypothetical protein
LNLWHCKGINDLKPLEGMPLKYLELGGCGGVNNLTPLKDLPLTHLTIANCGQVRDLTPLTGLQLIRLRMDNSGVKDLTPLQGMNLTEVYLTPKNITKGMDVLRQMSTLRTIGTSPDQAKNKFKPQEFWRKYDLRLFD